MKIGSWMRLGLVLVVCVTTVLAVDSDEEGKPVAPPTKKPAAKSTAKRSGQPGVVPPAAAPVQAPAVPALPTNSDGVAPAAAMPPPEVEPVEHAGDRAVAAGFQAKWWSHSKPSFCEKLSGDLPLLKDGKIDSRFQDRWGRFASSLRTVIRDGEAVNRFFELARVICPPEIYDEMAHDAFDWVVDARTNQANRRITRRAESAAEEAKEHAKGLGCDEEGSENVYNNVRDNLLDTWGNELEGFVDDFNNDFRESWNRRQTAMGVSVSALAAAAAMREEEEEEDEEDSHRGRGKKRARKRRSKSAPSTKKKPRGGDGKDSDDTGGGSSGMVL